MTGKLSKGEGACGKGRGQYGRRKEVGKIAKPREQNKTKKSL